MKQSPYALDNRSRRIVLATIHQVCAYRGWTLIAAHVRLSHVHVVVHADVTPEAVMHDFKAYASRLLKESEPTRRQRWARHGSTRYLWKKEDVEDTVRYVVERQGEAMAVFVNTAP